VNYSKSQLMAKVSDLLSQMTLAEKIGQLNHLNAEGDSVHRIKQLSKEGRVGSVLNQIDVDIINELQQIAVEQSRLGIPLLIARDVIHGFKTIMPIPLGQAATWNPEVVKQGAQIAAREAASVGVNWTFAPMIDISRDARWGRIAESLGEDPLLSSDLGLAMVKGFQGDDLSKPNAIAACVKHFVGYGASEAGRDYSATNIPENELRNIYLPPFKAAVEAGVETIMCSFSDLDGVPCTANDYLLNDILRSEWGFDGLVVSDWNSVSELVVHGIAEDTKQATQLAINAGVDMEMEGEAYSAHIESLLDENKITIEQIDRMVATVLALKFKLGLFENPYTQSSNFPALVDEQAKAVAKQAALESIVMLKNNQLLPFDNTKTNIALIGPMADAPYEQLGTWIFDGESKHSVTVRTALEAYAKQDNSSIEVNYIKALANTRSDVIDDLEQMLAQAKQADVIVLALGEESILSGEAHSRANIDLPGAQEQLIHELKALDKPIVGVIMAGRPLTLNKVINELDALLYAWHPGTMGGEAIVDLLFGKASPSGKLPVSFPSVVGQIPIYYNHKNTGRPPEPDNVISLEDIEEFAPQTSLGMSAFHMDAGYEPLFPFGFGLTYGQFEYSDLRLNQQTYQVSEPIEVMVSLTNKGAHQATEVVQLYIRDHVGSVTRPVKELKAYKRVTLDPSENKQVSFTLSSDDLAFYNRRSQLVIEPGLFSLWVGASSAQGLHTEFTLINNGT
jgi:beta-glucosidase